MGVEPTKQAVWERWVTATVLADIDDEATPDPVVMIDDGADVTMTDAYRLGRGEGDYLYLLYLLEAPTYLWIRAWDSEQDLGPYGYPVSLAAVEALLIRLAHAAFPEQLLNHKEVPETAPANRREYGFEPADP